MIKVLAAEMSDSGRLGRGKRYWNDEAVIDLVIGHGVVTAEVQGSRAHPYVVTIAATPGDGVPSRRNVRVQCTCPDDDGFDAACKHAVAALFALSDEVAIDPTVIDRWRGKVDHISHGDRSGGSDDDEDHDPHDPDVDRSGWASVTRLQPRSVRPWERTGSRDREDRQDVEDFDDNDDDNDAADGLHEVQGTRLNRVVPLRRRPIDAATTHDDELESGNGSPRSSEARPVPERAPASVDPSVALIASMLHSPSGVGPPSFPPAHPVVHPPLADRLVHEVLVSALDEFDVNWS